MCVCELGFVHARSVVGRKGVGDEEAERRLHYEDLGVGAKKNVCIGAVCLDRLRRAQDGRENNGGLCNVSATGQSCSSEDVPSSAISSTSTA
jgi:hypothetical protein